MTGLLPSKSREWAALRALVGAERPSLPDRFAGDDARLARFSLEAAGIYFDFSKLHWGPAELAGLTRLAEVADLAGWRAKLAAGAVVNGSEGRAATHMALRAPDRRAAHAATKALVERVRGGVFGDIAHVIHIGIGGSALGPQLLVDALGAGGDGPAVQVVSNIDGVALARACALCDPARTLLVLVSKTFTTLETMTNADSALAWLAAGGVADPKRRVVAVTAAPDRARAWGVPDGQTLDFAESVGGRYSLWSAVGLPLALRCGWPAFEALLDGAAAMDAHFLAAPFERNAPVLAAMADVWAAAFLGCATRGIFAYDERLRLLPAFLQQLEMESNGKRVTRDGTPVDFPTAAISWGGVGTDAQHAVFQLLHQGTHADPLEFVAVVEPGHGLGGSHHRQLLANCFAQGAALMAGRSAETALATSGGDPVLAAAKSFPGNRPSATILLARLDAFALGALLAFYEARTFGAATLMGINPFDQWGVELGKEMATALSGGVPDGLDASTRALLGRAGL